MKIFFYTITKLCLVQEVKQVYRLIIQYPTNIYKIFRQFLIFLLNSDHFKKGSSNTLCLYIVYAHYTNVINYYQFSFHFSGNHSFETNHKLINLTKSRLFDLERRNLIAKKIIMRIWIENQSKRRKQVVNEPLGFCYYN